MSGNEIFIIFFYFLRKSKFETRYLHRLSNVDLNFYLKSSKYSIISKFMELL